jgi:hypothetical protein
MIFILNHFKNSMQMKNENVTGGMNNAYGDRDFVIICNICFIDVILVNYLGIIRIFVCCAVFEENLHI